MLRVGARDSVVPVAGASGDKMCCFFSCFARFPLSFAGVLRTSGTRAPGNKHGKQEENHGKPRQTISELTRSGQNTSRKHHRDSTISQNNFLFHFATQVKHQSQGHGRAAWRTNLTLNPQRQDHARRKDLDFPVGLTPQPPICILYIYIHQRHARTRTSWQSPNPSLRDKTHNQS